MAEIFANAHKVLIWLGRDTQCHADLAFRTMARYADRIKGNIDRSMAETGSFPWTGLTPFYPGGPFEVDEGMVNAIVNVLNRPW